ncbi:unnamed protein product [Meganyctiphanes norvegica]|uniref:Uncharacterized protein n=1 Tax=Meganyctiphanes norvegica TaxID=48144 RepID=A0AAV2R146_MEGNR
MAGAVQHQGSGHGMSYSHRGTRNAGGGERAVTFSLQPCDRSSSTCSSSSRSTLQAEDESSDYDVPISLADHRQLLDKAFLDSAVFDTDLHIEESDSESSEIASALLDFSVLDDGPEGDYDVPGRAVAVDSAYDSTMVADDLDETPTPSRGVTFDLQQESTYDVPTSCILGVADRAVNLPEVESQATDETDAGYSTDSPGMGSKFYDGAITKSFSKDVSDVIPKEVLEFMEGRGHVSLDIPEEAPIDLRMVLEDVGLSVPGEDSLSVSVGTPECARDSLVVSIDEGMESPTVEEKQFKSAKKGYIQDPPVVMKAGQKGNKMTKRAAVMRNRSVRKSIKELYVFRCSTFVDMLYFNTITYVLKYQ